MVGGTRASFYVCCAAAILALRYPVADSLDNAGNESKLHDHVLGEDGNSKYEETQEYPFNNVYYSYKIQSNQLVKGFRLNPPIDYLTPEGCSLVLEPIAHFCKVANTSIFSKMSAVKFENKVYINIDDDLTNVLTSDSTIVYKLKVINNNNTIVGETTVLIRVVQFLPAPDTMLEFEEPSYSIKLSYGRKGQVFQFRSLKTALKAIEKDVALEFEKQPEGEKHFSKKEYPFTGNYSLEYVPEHLLSKLRVNNNGLLEVIGNIDEGFYNFDVVAVDHGPNSSTILKAKSIVHLFVDNVAVCTSQVSNFIKAFSKHYIVEETNLLTVVPPTGSSNRDCVFAISHQYPFGGTDDFFSIDPKTGAVNVMKPVDKEAYAYDYMEEPSVYLRLKIHCPPPVKSTPVQPLLLSDINSIAYDPVSTIIQLVIVDTNDNLPTFADKHLVVGYPVHDVAETIVPRYLVQIKATDKDTGKFGRIQYSLRGNDAEDFVINPETGTIYCTRPANDSDTNRTFEVVAKDNEGKSGGSESVLPVTVKYLTYDNIIRVNVKFSTTEDYASIESQLSEITGVKVMSLTNDVVNTIKDGQWRTDRTLTVYGVNADGSLVSGTDLENKLANNDKILGISKYTARDDSEMGMSIIYATLFFFILSLVAMGLLYFGFIKNGDYWLCISSTSTTPLKEDMENMSQSNWITTFNRSNLSSSRVRFTGKSDSPMSRSKFSDNTSIIVENSLYEALPPKGSVNASNDCNTSIIQFDSKLSFEDDMIKLEKVDAFGSPTEDHSFTY